MVECRLTVHQYVDKQDLHGVQRIAHVKGRTDRYKRQSRNCRAELERQEILNIVEYVFAYNGLSHI